MNKTEHYNLNQWELTDRIRMEDFNADNQALDEALFRKFEPILLLDKSETVTNKKYWSFTLPFKPEEWFAYILHFDIPGAGAVYLEERTSTVGHYIKFIPPVAAVAAFPLRSDKTYIYFAPLAGATEGTMPSNTPFSQCLTFNLHSTSSSSNLQNGDFRVRAYGFR